MSNLEKQLARAEAIIEALVTENRLLKAEIAHLQKIIGTKSEFISTPKIENGITEAFMSTPKSENGITEGFISTPKIGNGITEGFMSTPKIGNGITEGFMSIPKSENGTETLSATLPKTIDPSLYLDVISQLKAGGVAYVKGKYLTCVARLIIHFHNGSPSDYGTLMKLTSLSRGGLAKNLSSMRRRGIIYNAGFQRYEISAWGKEILKKALIKYTSKKSFSA